MLLGLRAALLLACVASPSFADPPAPIRVALYDDAGSAGRGIPRVKEQLSSVPDLRITLIKAELIQTGGLKDFDVVIFTGGSGGKQAAALSPTGVAEVRKFVEQGGGYVGICAGSYLACEGFSWSAGLLNARTVSPKWKRGEGNVQIQATDRGVAVLGLGPEVRDVHYANGPIIKPALDPALTGYEVLASFRTELAENGSPMGVMADSPAIVAGTFGRGRVLCSSPHPEQTPGMESFTERAVRWTSCRADHP